MSDQLTSKDDAYTPISIKAAMDLKEAQVRQWAKLSDSPLRNLGDTDVVHMLADGIDRKDIPALLHRILQQPPVPENEVFNFLNISPTKFKELEKAEKGPLYWDDQELKADGPVYYQIDLLAWLVEEMRSEAHLRADGYVRVEEAATLTGKTVDELRVSMDNNNIAPERTAYGDFYRKEDIRSLKYGSLKPKRHH